MLKFKFLFLPISFGLIFVLVVLNVTPPQSLPKASPDQLFLFFIPLFLFITSLVNLFLKFLIKSLFLSFWIIVLLMFKSLDLLNPVTLIIFAVGLFVIFKYFKKTPKKLPFVKIPKLSSLQRQ